MAITFPSYPPKPAEPGWASSATFSGGAVALQSYINSTSTATTIDLSSSGTFNLTQTLNIPSGKIIKLIGPATLDGQGAVRVINIQSGGELWLENITVTNGGSVANGLGIVNDGVLGILSGTKIMNNHSTSNIGGVGVFNIGVMVMYGGSIEGNRAGSASQTLNGGGVFNNGTFYLDGGTITANASNSAINGFGGGVYNDFNGPGVFIMSGGEISQNLAYYGAGLYNAGAPDAGLHSYAKIYGTAKIVNNTGTLGGGIMNSGMLEIS